MLKWINKKRNKKGFTLVELVVVIAILGILGGIAIPRFGKSRETAKVATHNANVRILKSTATMYIADHSGDDPEKLEEEDLKAYFDGDDYPQVPTGLSHLKDAEENEIKGSYVITFDEGNIIVTPAEYKPEDEGGGSE